MGEALNTKQFWTCISTFSHPQTQERTTDEMYTHLFRTSTWAEEGTDCMKWWGINCMLHRLSLHQKELTPPTSFLTLSPTETLCLLTYITEPCTKDQATNCLLRVSESAKRCDNLVHNETNKCKSIVNTVTQRRC